ncbi:MAG: alpha-galactosidase, partial [Akkermansiaceae bacterium]|nr:alpha-galactosidase [Akkermansiaceae bacterium]
YMLDGTHPGARDYLRHVFRTMREEWQCRYFKLDANMWGALPFGRRHDPQATRVDAYRAGMQAIRDGAGEGSFI